MPTPQRQGGPAGGAAGDGVASSSSATPRSARGKGASSPTASSAAGAPAATRQSDRQRKRPRDAAALYDYTGDDDDEREGSGADVGPGEYYFDDDAARRGSVSGGSGARRGGASSGGRRPDVSGLSARRGGGYGSSRGYGHQPEGDYGEGDDDDDGGSYGGGGRHTARSSHTDFDGGDHSLAELLLGATRARSASDIGRELAGRSRAGSAVSEPNSRGIGSGALSSRSRAGSSHSDAVAIAASLLAGAAGGMHAQVAAERGHHAHSGSSSHYYHGTHSGEPVTGHHRPSIVVPFSSSAMGGASATSVGEGGNVNTAAQLSQALASVLNGGNPMTLAAASSLLASSGLLPGLGTLTPGLGSVQGAGGSPSNVNNAAALASQLSLALAAVSGGPPQTSPATVEGLASAAAATGGLGATGPISGMQALGAAGLMGGSLAAVGGLNSLAAALTGGVTAGKQAGARAQAAVPGADPRATGVDDNGSLTPYVFQAATGTGGGLQGLPAQQQPSYGFPVSARGNGANVGVPGALQLARSESAGTMTSSSTGAPNLAPIGSPQYQEGQAGSGAGVHAAAGRGQSQYAPFQSGVGRLPGGIPPLGLGLQGPYSAAGTPIVQQGPPQATPGSAGSGNASFMAQLQHISSLAGGNSGGAASLSALLGGVGGVPGAYRGSNMTPLPSPTLSVAGGQGNTATAPGGFAPSVRVGSPDQTSSSSLPGASSASSPSVGTPAGAGSHPVASVLRLVPVPQSSGSATSAASGSAHARLLPPALSAVAVGGAGGGMGGFNFPCATGDLASPVGLPGAPGGFQPEVSSAAASSS